MKRLRKGRGRGPGVRWFSMDPWEEKGASHPFCCPLLDLTGSRSQTGGGSSERPDSGHLQWWGQISTCPSCVLPETQLALPGSWGGSHLR